MIFGAEVEAPTVVPHGTQRWHAITPASLASCGAAGAACSAAFKLVVGRRAGRRVQIVTSMIAMAIVTIISAPLIKTLSRRLWSRARRWRCEIIVRAASISGLLLGRFRGAGARARRAPDSRSGCWFRMLRWAAACAARAWSSTVASTSGSGIVSVGRHCRSGSTLGSVGSPACSQRTIRPLRCQCDSLNTVPWILE